MRYMTGVIFILTYLISPLSFSAQTNQPFERGALTDAQKNAWQLYVNEASSLYGCEYGDDPRLSEFTNDTLNALADKVEMEPVQVTYRTLLNMGPIARQLISNNIKVASIECNTVYFDGERLIGMPVLPFEEALSILHDDLANYGDIERIKRLKNTFIVAQIDPRWFWTFFIVDQDHMDLLGFNYDILVKISEAINAPEELGKFKKYSDALLYTIYQGLHSFPIKYYSKSAQCEHDNSEPPGSLFVWPEITDKIVKWFYALNNIQHKGKWSVKAEKQQEGYVLYQEKAVENVNLPLFSVTRGLTIYSAECH
tara:strand:+ start:4191 stop:5123 length:933 start_codon:yes stop_codon:yes gene_type:complete